MTKNTAEELAALRQEVKDFKEETFPKLREIKDKVNKTNGTVAKVTKEHMITRERQNNCPAKKYHKNPNQIQDQIKNIKIWGIIIAALVMIIQIIAIFK